MRLKGYWGRIRIDRFGSVDGDELDGGEKQSRRLVSSRALRTPRQPPSEHKKRVFSPFLLFKRKISQVRLFLSRRRIRTLITSLASIKHLDDDSPALFWDWRGSRTLRPSSRLEKEKVKALRTMGLGCGVFCWMILRGRRVDVAAMSRCTFLRT